jgi:Phage tail assembly chaperone protein
MNLQEAHDAKWAEVRKARDKLLLDTDWVVVRSLETKGTTAKAWADYRQALRDLTTADNPFLIAWPSPPAGAASTRRIYVQAP